MAALWIDGFELGSAAAIGARYDSTYGALTLGTSSGRTGQYGEQQASNFSKYIATTDRVIVGIARKWGAGISEVNFITILDSAHGPSQLTLREKSDGTYELWRGAGGSGTLLATSPAVSPGFWIYIELFVLVHASAGAYMLRINEVPMFSAANVNTQATGNANVGGVNINGRATNGGTPSYNYIDDFYIADEAAPLPNVTPVTIDDGGSGIDVHFWGNLKIEHRVPSGAGTTTQWTALTDSNYANVDENPHDSDTTYNYTNSVDSVDTYAVEDMVAVSGNVRNVQTTIVARKDDALARSAAAIVRSGSTDYLGATRNLTTTYGYYVDEWPQDPDTDADWDLAGVNAMEIGAKVVS